MFTSFVRFSCLFEQSKSSPTKYRDHVILIMAFWQWPLFEQITLSKFMWKRIGEKVSWLQPGENALYIAKGILATATLVSSFITLEVDGVFFSGGDCIATLCISSSVSDDHEWFFKWLANWGLRWTYIVLYYGPNNCNTDTNGKAMPNVLKPNHQWKRITCPEVPYN